MWERVIQMDWAFIKDRAEVRTGWRKERSTKEIV